MAETGKLILRAVDIDTGKPIAGVSFAIENGYDEDWAVEVGKADAEGVLRFEARRRPGYYYMVWKKPKHYKVVGYDDAYINVVPGDTVNYDFKRPCRTIHAFSAYSRAETDLPHALKGGPTWPEHVKARTKSQIGDNTTSRWFNEAPLRSGLALT
jgi:hypothetical protein